MKILKAKVKFWSWILLPIEYSHGGN